MSTCIYIIGRDITEPFVVTPVVVVLDECFNSFLQFAWHFVWHELNISLDGAVVSFYLTVGLRVISGGYDVLDPHQPQVFTKLSGKIAGAIIRDKHRPKFVWCLAR
jgi:hypothetical protein